MKKHANKKKERNSQCEYVNTHTTQNPQWSNADAGKERKRVNDEQINRLENRNEMKSVMSQSVKRSLYNQKQREEKRKQKSTKIGGLSGWKGKKC